MVRPQKAKEGTLSFQLVMAPRAKALVFMNVMVGFYFKFLGIFSCNYHGTCHFFPIAFSISLIFFLLFLISSVVVSSFSLRGLYGVCRLCPIPILLYPFGYFNPTVDGLPTMHSSRLLLSSSHFGHLLVITYTHTHTHMRDIIQIAPDRDRARPAWRIGQFKRQRRI